MRSTILAAGLLSLILGCSESEKEERFQSQDEERAYLSALSNPTPKQWKRLQSLNEAKEATDKASDEYNAAELAKDLKQWQGNGDNRD